MKYQRRHVMDTTIENESSPRGLEVTVYADSLGKVIIMLGNSMTIRTDVSGALELADTIQSATEPRFMDFGDDSNDTA